MTEQPAIQWMWKILVNPFKEAQHQIRLIESNIFTKEEWYKRFGSTWEYEIEQFERNRRFLGKLGIYKER